MTRVYNFSAGPAVLPVKVLQEAQSAVLELPGAGSSILEISHRSKPFAAVHEEAKTLLRQLLEIPAGYQILFLQGGSSLQFTMLPMNLLGEKQTADYILTGTWGKKGFDEARRLWDRRRGRVAVKVRTAAPLDQAQIEALRAKVAGLTQGGEPVLNVVTDPDLIGGLVVQIGDVVLDASVRNRLEQIRKRLIEGKTHEIQKRRDQFSHSA